MTNAPAAERYVRPFTYRAVPRFGPGVCRVCHAGPNGDYEQCYSCMRTTSQVSHPIYQTVPISLYKLGDQLHTVLRGYKDGRREAEREAHRFELAAMLALFLQRHERCLALPVGEFTLATTVPSTGSRLGTVHPFTDVIDMVRQLKGLYKPVLQRGAGQVDHGLADDTAFTVTRPVKGRRILLLDDTFTTGARIQSAASALTLAGAEAVAALVIGRIIGPDHNDNCRTIWERATNTAFTFDQCCECPA